MPIMITIDIFTCSGSIVTECDPSVNFATENDTGLFAIVLSVKRSPSNTYNIFTYLIHGAESS